MIGLPSEYLFFNGSIIILAGLLSGIPLRYAIVKARDEVVNSWRVTHTVLVTDGILLLIVGLIIPHIALDILAVWVLVWSLVVSGYSFVIAFVIGSWKRIRGLTPKPYGLNTLLFAFHVIGASGSIVAISIIIFGFLKTIL